MICIICFFFNIVFEIKYFHLRISIVSQKPLLIGEHNSQLIVQKKTEERKINGSIEKKKNSRRWQKKHVNVLDANFDYSNQITNDYLMSKVVNTP